MPDPDLQGLKDELDLSREDGASSREDAHLEMDYEDRYDKLYHEEDDRVPDEYEDDFLDNL